MVNKVGLGIIALGFMSLTHSCQVAEKANASAATKEMKVLRKLLADTTKLPAPVDTFALSGVDANAIIRDLDPPNVCEVYLERHPDAKKIINRNNEIVLMNKVDKNVEATSFDMVEGMPQTQTYFADANSFTRAFKSKGDIKPVIHRHNGEIVGISNGATFVRKH